MLWIFYPFIHSFQLVFSRRHSASPWEMHGDKRPGFYAHDASHPLGLTPRLHFAWSHLVPRKARVPLNGVGWCWDIPSGVWMEHLLCVRQCFGHSSDQVRARQGPFQSGLKGLWSSHWCPALKGPSLAQCFNITTLKLLMIFEHGALHFILRII